MYARVTTVDMAAMSAETGDRVVREQVLPSARQLEGFRGALNLIDATSGRAMTITLWDSQKAMERSEAAANELRAQATQTSGVTSPPSVDRYEVRLFEIC